MADLKITTKTTHHVNFFDLEQFIKDLYGITYEIAAAEECGNDTTLHFSVDGKIADYEMDDMRKLLAGEWVSYRTGLLMNLMCFNEEIPAGEYYVEVSW